MLIRAARRGAYEGGGGGQGRCISWFWSGYMRPCSCCLCVRALAEPGDRPRGDAFCPVAAGCLAMAGSVPYFAGWWRIQRRVASAAEGATSRGAQRRLVVEGWLSPMVLGNDREARSAGLLPSPD
ncbi:hypothetical protein B0H14DRAFT_2856543, partial [Mycena olivaceomarginata]